MIYPIKSPF